MNETKVIQVTKDTYRVIIHGFDFGEMCKSDIRQLIQTLDSGIYQ